MIFCRFFSVYIFLGGIKVRAKVGVEAQETMSVEIEAKMPFLLVKASRMTLASLF